MSASAVGELFSRFVDVIRQLRTPGTGCPWDLKQDHRSLRPYLIEEAYEVLQAIESNDDAAFCDELGDVLLQVVLHAQVAADRNAFAMTDVLENVIEKMIRRHPHVFGNVQVEGSDDVVKNWEEIKLAEKTSNQHGDAEPSDHPITDKLTSIPPSVPALLRAQRLGEKAARVHFDWDSFQGVLAKVKEELSELETELARHPGLLSAEQEPEQAHAMIGVKQRGELEHELGDLLFSLCQLARWSGVNAEDSLRNCAERFITRFREMELSVTQPLRELSEDELDKAWEQAKASLRKG